MMKLKTVRFRLLQAFSLLSYVVNLVGLGLCPKLSCFRLTAFRFAAYRNGHPTVSILKNQHFRPQILIRPANPTKKAFEYVKGFNRSTEI
jgi:hypothetical protein